MARFGESVLDAELQGSVLMRRGMCEPEARLKGMEIEGIDLRGV